MDATLKVLGGPLSGQSLRLPRKLLIGRAEDCDFRIESDFVSRYHCILSLDKSTLRVRDLGSKNGTYVNGRRVGTNAIILLHDDNICIGEVNLLIDMSPDSHKTKHTSFRPEAKSSSTRLDEAVLLGGTQLRAERADSSPTSVSKPAPPNVFPPASDPVGPPERREDGDG